MAGISPRSIEKADDVPIIAAGADRPLRIAIILWDWLKINLDFVGPARIGYTEARTNGTLHGPREGRGNRSTLNRSRLLEPVPKTGTQREIGESSNAGFHDQGDRDSYGV